VHGGRVYYPKELGTLSGVLRLVLESQLVFVPCVVQIAKVIALPLRAITSAVGMRVPPSMPKVMAISIPLLSSGLRPVTFGQHLRTLPTPVREGNAFLWSAYFSGKPFSLYAEGCTIGQGNKANF